jgi:hypothetical protein
MNFSEPTRQVLLILQKSNPELLTPEENFILLEKTGLEMLPSNPAQTHTQKIRSKGVGFNGSIKC